MGKSHKEQVFRENQACYGAMERTRVSQRGSPSDDPWSQGEEDALSHLSQVELDEGKVQGLLQAPTAGWVSTDECEPQSHHLSPAGSLLKKPSVLVHTIPGPQPFQ